MISAASAREEITGEVCGVSSIGLIVEILAFFVFPLSAIRYRSRGRRCGDAQVDCQDDSNGGELVNRITGDQLRRASVIVFRFAQGDPVLTSPRGKRASGFASPRQ